MTTSPLDTQFSDPLFTPLDSSHIPKHVAMIMDGNRRWAKQRDLPTAMGYWEGAEVLTSIVRTASELGVQTVTIYAFSTENWKRPKEEIDVIMQVLEIYLICEKDLMIREGIRLDMIGNLEKFPKTLRDAFHLTKQATEHCRKINLVLALNYGARDEIRRAVTQILHLHQAKGLSPEDITEEMIAEHLDTSPFGDPELMIRTGGELRVSNFLLWQISYAELYVTEKLWPDFSSKDLAEAVMVFQHRKRRFGG